jgi:hypothetical protein
MSKSCRICNASSALVRHHLRMSGHSWPGSSYDRHQTVNRDEEKDRRFSDWRFLTGLHCLVRDPGTRMIKGGQLCPECPYHGIKVDERQSEVAEGVEVSRCRQQYLVASSRLRANGPSPPIYRNRSSYPGTTGQISVEFRGGAVPWFRPHNLFLVYSGLVARSSTASMSSFFPCFLRFLPSVRLFLTTLFSPALSNS